jgi:nucleotide-binding universal stress UspA family protein
MRIATFGDIHGNLFALQAVLADLRTQKPDGLLVTGDLVYKFPWGAEVVDLLRSLPCQIILGNAELYLALWGTSLWPAKWNLPRARELVMWERERLGGERLAWLASLPEHATFSGGRLEDLVAVHGVPGNPFVPFLARPGEDRSPWVQSDARVRELLAGLDADVVVCGHTHTPLLRQVDRTLVVNPGALGYGRGANAGVGRADYALLDWPAAAGWRVSFRSVSYDPEPLHRALLALRGDYPVAAYVANRMRPSHAAPVPDEGLDFVRYCWGDAPDWWEERDALPVWRGLRGDGAAP